MAWPGWVPEFMQWDPLNIMGEGSDLGAFDGDEPEPSSPGPTPAALLSGNLVPILVAVVVVVLLLKD